MNKLTKEMLSTIIAIKLDTRIPMNIIKSYIDSSFFAIKEMRGLDEAEAVALELAEVLEDFIRGEDEDDITDEETIKLCKTKYDVEPATLDVNSTGGVSSVMIPLPGSFETPSVLH